MSWDDEGGFDEGWGDGPEGFSDFREEWGTVDAFWEGDGDSAGPDPRGGYDEGWNAREDAFDTEWEQTGSQSNSEWLEDMVLFEDFVAVMEQDKEAANQEFEVGQFEPITDDFHEDQWTEAAEAAESIDAEWNAGLPGDGEDRRADDEDDDNDDRTGPGTK